MIVKGTDQRGFTLIELLTVIVLLGILAGLAVRSFYVVRNRAYKARVEAMVHDLRVGVTASRVGGRLSPDGWYGAWSNQPGPIVAGDGTTNLAPGVMNAKNMNVWVWTDGGCESGLFGTWCGLDGGNVSHCKSGFSMGWFTGRGGGSSLWEWQGAPGC